MTADTRMKVLVIGATGSIGQLVVAEAIRDMANQPLADEPERVRSDLETIRARRAPHPNPQ
jgi:uncharacterized protein YbjT (DUF2867 family)